MLLVPFEYGYYLVNFIFKYPYILMYLLVISY